MTPRSYSVKIGQLVLSAELKVDRNIIVYTLGSKEFQGISSNFYTCRILTGCDSEIDFGVFNKSQVSLVFNNLQRSFIEDYPPLSTTDPEKALRSVLDRVADARAYAGLEPLEVTFPPAPKVTLGGLDIGFDSDGDLTLGGRYVSYWADMLGIPDDFEFEDHTDVIGNCEQINQCRQDKGLNPLEFKITAQ